MQSTAQLILGPKHRRFVQLVDELAVSFEALMTSGPFSYPDLPATFGHTLPWEAPGPATKMT